MTPDELPQIIAQLPDGRRVTVVVIEHTGTASTDLQAATPGGAGAGGKYVSVIDRVKFPR